MIVVCEPQCKRNSHEKVNSGFIYGLHLAYPKEKILFFSESGHAEAIKAIFKTNHIGTDFLEHKSIEFNSDKSFSIWGIVSYYFLIKEVFDKTFKLKESKVFFLSINPIILYVIKKIKSFKKYESICCTFTLHGELEDIANLKYQEPYVPVVKYHPAKLIQNDVFAKIWANRKKVLPFILFKIKSMVRRPFLGLYLRYSLIFKRIFRIKKMMLWRHTDQYKYVSLSPHVTENAKKYINVDYLNFNTIIMPIIYPKPYPIANNKFIKFAVFGYGDSAQMYKMLTILSKRKIEKPYEIRIISMDNGGTEGFQNIRLVSDGKVLSRKQMEDAIPDIDVFINLYDKNRHRFGCSLSIFESLAYLKPVLHLSNPGYNYFNKNTKPIGFRCDNLEIFVGKMTDMIENFPQYKSKLKVFRDNMLEFRREYTIENNLDKLKEAFAF